MSWRKNMVQEQMRDFADPILREEYTSIHRRTFLRWAAHIDQLEDDKAELVGALRTICLAIDAIDGHEKPADWGNLGAAQGDAENLIAKHKAKP